MYTIAKKFYFSASHQLPADKLPEGHPCARLHGHNYEVELILADAKLENPGFIVDYRTLDAFKNYLDLTFDHKHLNDVVGNTTAESLAKFFFDYASTSAVFGHQVKAVRVSETNKTWAEFRP